MRWAAEIAAWAAVCIGVWLCTLSTITAQELLLAASAGIVCGFGAAASRRLVGGRWTLRVTWLRWVGQLCLSAPIETAQVLWAAARRQGGEQTTVQLPRSETQKVSASRRGVGALMLSASPGSYLIDSDPDACAMSVHRLGGGAPEPIRIDPGLR